MAEEVRHPATQLPRAMVYSVPIGTISGLMFLLPIVFTLPDIPTLLAASRATWSFARDKAIPFHHIFARISGDANDPSAVPYNAHILSTTVQLLLGLIYLGSSAAFNAFVGVGLICLGASYAMPVAILLFNGNGRTEMKDAPYSLGRWGFALNIATVLWVALEIVLFSMPAVIPVDQMAATITPVHRPLKHE
ncbi:hypothetical protein H0H87_009423 [Tephrocybe sp. NHM501043]|nr:hypothetical protein H0H87_009423 [Tephrocybe sp. NHM501043]